MTKCCAVDHTECDVDIRAVRVKWLPPSTESLCSKPLEDVSTMTTNTDKGRFGDTPKPLLPNPPDWKRGSACSMQQNGGDRSSWSWLQGWILQGHCTLAWIWCCADMEAWLLALAVTNSVKCWLCFPWWDAAPCRGDTISFAWGPLGYHQCTNALLTLCPEGGSGPSWKSAVCYRDWGPWEDLS